MLRGGNFSFKVDQVDVCFYHSPCDDGHASAAVLYSANPKIEFVGKQPKDKVQAGDCYGKNVVLCDVCFDLDTMMAMAVLAKNILILDHHASNLSTIQELAKSYTNVAFVFGDENTAGVNLAWDFVYGTSRPLPNALRAIGLKDVYKHENDCEALNFCQGWKRPERLSDWGDFISNDQLVFMKCYEHGKVINIYREHVMKTMLEKVEYTSFRGFAMAYCNVPFPWTSDMGHLMCQQNPDITIAVLWTKTVTGKYCVSLRSDNKYGPSCIPLAKEFGGGGHVHACGGIEMDQPPFEIWKE